MYSTERINSLCIYVVIMRWKNVSNIVYPSFCSYVFVEEWSGGPFCPGTARERSGADHAAPASSRPFQDLVITVGPYGKWLYMNLPHIHVQCNWILHNHQKLLHPLVSNLTCSILGFWCSPLERIDQNTPQPTGTVIVRWVETSFLPEITNAEYLIDLAKPA